MLQRSTFSSDSDCRTQMQIARQGTVSPEMRRVAEREQPPAETVRDEVARGRMIIPPTCITAPWTRWPSV
jgi:phosphomethylpyrimidine synthase